MSFINSVKVDSTSRQRLAYQFVSIQLFIYLFSGATEWLVQSSYRTHVILGALLSFLYLPFLVETLGTFLRKAKRSAGLVALYFMIHPFLIIGLYIFGIRQLPDGVGWHSVLFSSMAWYLNGIIVLVALIHWEVPQHRRFLGLLFGIGLFLALESLADYYLLRGTPIFTLVTENEVRFGSVFRVSAYACGCLGFILSALSLYFYYTEKPSMKYRFSFVMGVILIVSSLQRVVIAGFAFFLFCLFGIYLFRGWRRVRPERKFVMGIVLAIALLCGSLVLGFGIASMRADSFSSAASLYDRVMMWTRGVDIGAHFFPIGSGGSLAGKYATSNVVGTPFSFLLASNATKAAGHSLNVSFGVVEGRYGAVRSLHNTHMELFVEFGLLGLVIVFFLFYHPLSLFVKNCRKISRSLDGTIMGAAIFSIFLFSFQILLFGISTGTHLLWIVLLLYVYSYKAHRGSLQS